MYFNHIYIHSPNPQRSSLLPYLPNFVSSPFFFFFKPIRSSLYCLYIPRYVSIYWTIIYLPRTTSLKKTDSLSQKLSMANSSPATDEALCSCLFSVLGLYLVWACMGLKHAVPTTVSSFLYCPVVWRKQFSSSHSLLLEFTISLSLLPLMIPYTMK